MRPEGKSGAMFIMTWHLPVDGLKCSDLLVLCW